MNDLALKLAHPSHDLPVQEEQGGPIPQTGCKKGRRAARGKGRHVANIWQALLVCTLLALTACRQTNNPSEKWFMADDPLGDVPNNKCAVVSGEYTLVVFCEKNRFKGMAFRTIEKQDFNHRPDTFLGSKTRKVKFRTDDNPVIELSGELRWIDDLLGYEIVEGGDPKTVLKQIRDAKQRIVVGAEPALHDGQAHQHVFPVTGAKEVVTKMVQSCGIDLDH
jgi:hypothetical protein